MAFNNGGNMNYPLYCHQPPYERASHLVNRGYNQEHVGSNQFRDPGNIPRHALPGPRVGSGLSQSIQYPYHNSQHFNVSQMRYDSQPNPNIPPKVHGDEFFRHRRSEDLNFNAGNPGMSENLNIPPKVHGDEFFRHRRSEELNFNAGNPGMSENLNIPPKVHGDEFFRHRRSEELNFNAGNPGTIEYEYGNSNAVEQGGIPVFDYHHGENRQRDDSSHEHNFSGNWPPQQQGFLGGNRPARNPGMSSVGYHGGLENFERDRRNRNSRDHPERGVQRLPNNLPPKTEASRNSKRRHSPCREGDRVDKYQAKSRSSRPYDRTSSENHAGNRNKDATRQKIENLKNDFDSKFESFVNCLKMNRKNSCDIIAVENALQSSGLFKLRKYDVKPSGTLYVGTLMVGDVVLAKGGSNQKKDAKRVCFKAAVHTLINEPLDKILSQTEANVKTLTSKSSEGKTTPSMLSATPRLDVEMTLSNLKVFVKQLKRYQTNDTSTKEIVDWFIESYKKGNSSWNHTYQVDKINLKNSKVWFRGKLYLNQIPLGVGGGFTRQLAKERTYKKAWEYATTHPIPEMVMMGFIPDEDDMAIPVCKELSDQHAKLPNKFTEKKLASFGERVRNFLPWSSQEGFAADVGAVFKELELVTTVLFSKVESQTRGQKMTEASLYLDDVFIVSATAGKQTEAEAKMNADACKLFVSKTAEELLKNQPRLTDEIRDDLKYFQVHVKGQMKQVIYSNDKHLTKNKFSPRVDESEQKKIRLSDIVIFEEDADSMNRYIRAYRILLNTSIQNRMQLHVRQANIGSTFKVEIMVQGDKCGEGEALTEIVARTCAAADMLFKLYESQPTIKIMDQNIPSLSHSFDALQAKADELKAEQGGDDSDDIISITLPVKSPMPKDGQDADNEAALEEDDQSDTEVDAIPDATMAPDEEPPTVVEINKWVKNVIEEMVDRFAKMETLAVLGFGPDFSPGYRAVVLKAGKTHNMIYHTRHILSCAYVTLTKRTSVQERIKILEANGGQSGRFVLVDKKELPKYKDLKPLVLAQKKLMPRK